MADWNLGGLNWSDNPVIVSGNEGEPGTAMYQTPGFDLSQQDWNQLGYNGQYGTDPISENGAAQSNEFNGVQDWLKNNSYRVGQTWDPSGSLRYSGIFGQDNKMVGNPIMHDLNDADFGLAMQLAAGLMGNAGLEMAGWGSGFGGGAAGKAVQGATLGSIGAGLGGGNPFTGAATGALSGGAVGAINPAGQVGITNPALSNVFNTSVGSGLRTLASGGNLEEAGKSALTSGITSGIGEGGKYLASSLGSNNMSELPWNDNPAMNASYPTGGYQPPGVQALAGTGMTPEMSYAPQLNSSFGDALGSFTNPTTNQGNTREQPSSASSPGMSFSLPNMGQVGNWALNNAGDLAGMLYGFMNNRKQQRQLGGMMSGLQGLYSQNSPYAQQLRQSLAAKDAAAGRRSQYANREVQLQSNLAHMASQQIPAMYQMQIGQNQLQNQNMMGILNTLGKTGVFKGLSGMFGGGGQFANGPTPMPGYNAPMQWGMNNRGMDLPVINPAPVYRNDESTGGFLDGQ